MPRLFLFNDGVTRMFGPNTLSRIPRLSLFFFNLDTCYSDTDQTETIFIDEYSSEFDFVIKYSRNREIHLTESEMTRLAFSRICHRWGVLEPSRCLSCGGMYCNKIGTGNTSRASSYNTKLSSKVGLCRSCECSARHVDSREGQHINSKDSREGQHINSKDSREGQHINSKDSREGHPQNMFQANTNKGVSYPIDKDVLPSMSGPSTLIPSMSGPSTLIPSMSGPSTLIPSMSGPSTLIPSMSGVSLDPLSLFVDPEGASNQTIQLYDYTGLMSTCLVPSPSCMVLPNTVSPNVVLLNTVPPNVVLPNTVSPNVVLPNTVPPNVVLLNTVPPNVVLPNTVSPNVVLPNTVPPNVVLPNTVPPNVVLPNTPPGIVAPPPGIVAPPPGLVAAPPGIVPTIFQEPINSPINSPINTPKNTAIDTPIDTHGNDSYAGDNWRSAPLLDVVAKCSNCQLCCGSCSVTSDISDVGVIETPEPHIGGMFSDDDRRSYNKRYNKRPREREVYNLGEALGQESQPDDLYDEGDDSKPSLKNKNPLNLKTKICRNFRRGECSKTTGECWYAHGTVDRRHTMDVYKTKVCYYYENGDCKAGDRCSFAHGCVELVDSQVPSLPSSIHCYSPPFIR